MKILTQKSIDKINRDFCFPKTQLVCDECEKTVNEVVSFTRTDEVVHLDVIVCKSCLFNAVKEIQEIKP